MPQNDGKEDDRIMESLILCKYDIKNIMAFSSDQREITPLWTCLPYGVMVSSIPTITKEDTTKGKKKKKKKKKISRKDITSVTNY
jgi:hypothetical protein